MVPLLMTLSAPTDLIIYLTLQHVRSSASAELVVLVWLSETTHRVQNIVWIRC